VVKISGTAALSWLTKHPPEIHEAKQSIENVVKDASRAADVISRIRSMVSKAAPSKDMVDIHEVILEVIGLVRAQATKAGITI
jgi:nitrogen-specific signal transduction histidine kinase